MSYALNSVYVADAIDFVQNMYGIKVDLTITSPPYNKCESARLESIGNRKIDIEYENENGDDFQDCMDEDLYQYLQIKLLNLIYDITAPNGALFYNHRVRYKNGKLIHPISWLSRTKWNIYQEIIWDKNIILNPDKIRFYHVDERIYWLQKGKFEGELSKEAAGWKTIWRISERVPDFAREHPAPFRPSIPRRIIQAFLGDKPGLVFDPYCGVGTTLIEAKRLGKKYLGCDISEKYVKIAREQLTLTENPLV